MAAILLDIDGVFHVSGKPIAGAADAVTTLRERGHRLRFVTNTTVRTRSAIVAELKRLGVDIADDELQTTAAAAVRLLRGRRVLALTMPSVIEDLDGLDLVGEDADAVLVGGADEGDETGRVFSYMNLARAFAELQAGRGSLLPAQEPLVADVTRARCSIPVPSSPGSSTRPASRPLSSASRAPCTSRPRSRRSTPSRSSRGWWETTSRRTSRAAQRYGMRTALVRTGKFRPDDLERSGIAPDIVVNSLAELPDWLEKAL